MTTATTRNHPRRREDSMSRLITRAIALAALTLHPRRPTGPREPEARGSRLIDRSHLARQRLQPLDRRRGRPRQPRPKDLARAELYRRRRRLARVHVQPSEADTVSHVDASFPSMR